MLFNSIGFIFYFLPLVIFGFYFLGHYRPQLATLWLCGASLYFFCQWNVHYVWLLLISVAVNYCFGYWISFLGPLRSNKVLVVAISCNLFLLGYYKYAGFFTDTINRSFGLSWSFGKIILPLGISFFTFTQIAFLVDSYRGKAKEYNFSHYLLFVTYFPHLIAGPILHHSQMMPQFALKKTYLVNWENNTKGLLFFTIGLAKKILFADTLSTYSTPIFDFAATGKTPLFIDAWMAILAFSLQLYFDFSGYCDMAVGISYFFNIKLPWNFNSPYKATSIIDFWRRWHMTLSTFLRDYLYIPLGGNRHGTVRRWFNVFVTMLIGGLWHGAGWTFVIWGGLHGFYLIVNHCFQSLRARIGWPDVFFGWFGKTGSLILTFFSVVIAWVFFRSPNLNTAVHMFSGMTDLNQFYMFNSINFGKYFVIYLGLIVVWFFPNTQQWLGMQDMNIPSDAEKSKLISCFKWNPEFWWNWAIPGIILAFCILHLTNGKASEFLYFQF